MALFYDPDRENVRPGYGYRDMVQHENMTIAGVIASLQLPSPSPTLPNNKKIGNLLTLHPTHSANPCNLTASSQRSFYPHHLQLALLYHRQHSKNATALTKPVFLAQTSISESLPHVLVGPFYNHMAFHTLLNGKGASRVASFYVSNLPGQAKRRVLRLH